MEQIGVIMRMECARGDRGEMGARAESKGGKDQVTESKVKT